MRKITLLLMVMAVMWVENIYAQAYINDIKYQEDFTSTTGTWIDGTQVKAPNPPAAGASTFTSTIDATNKNSPVSIKTYAASFIAAPKAFGSNYTSESGKITISFICKIGAPNSSVCGGYFYFRDANNKPIFGLGVVRLSSNYQAVRLTTYTEYQTATGSYPNIANSQLLPTVVNSPALSVVAVLDFNNHTIDLTATAGTYTAGASPDFVATTPSNQYSNSSLAFLDNTAANVSNIFFEANNSSASGGVSASEHFRFDDFKITGQKLVTAAASATVDASFDITFNDDAAWRGAISGITVGGTTLDPSAYNKTTAGKITFTPSASTLLQTPGSKSIVISATGYSDVTITQAIGVGVANKLAMKTQPAAPASNGDVLGTQPAVYIQDQYGNNTTSTASITAAIGNGTWTIGGSTTKAAVAGTATFTDLTASSAVSVSGATISFSSTGLTSTSSASFTVPAPVGSLSGPNLTSASGSTVDAPFDVTFTDNTTWRNAITGITVNGTTLSSDAYSVSSGKITFTPSASTSLQSNGDKLIVISASGYGDASTTQTIGVGTAAQLVMKTQPVTPTSNAAAFATQPQIYIKDQYGNLTTGGTVVASVTSPQTWLLNGTTSVDGSSGTATFTDLTAGTTGKVAYSAATLTFTYGSLTITSNAFDIIAYQSSTSDNFQTKQSGIWSDPTTWNSSPDAGTNWYAATIAPGSANTTILASYPVTYTNTTDFSQSGFSMENNAELDLKPGGATTYAGNITPLSGKTITIASNNTITIKSYTEANAKNLTVFYTPTISSTTPTVNMDLNNAGRLYSSSAQWSTGYAMTLPTNTQLNVTSSVGSAGFAISTDSKFLNTRIALGNNVRVLRQYNVVTTTGSTIDIGELSSIDTNPSTCTSTLEGSWVTTDQTRILTYSIGSLGTSSTFAGTFKNYPLSGAPAVYIKKVGSGNLTLSGTYSNLISGQLNVTSGTVTLNGSLPNSAVTASVSTGATLTGTGYIAGATTINGTLGGSLSFSGAVTLSSGSTISPDTYITLITNGTNSGTLALQNGTTLPNLVVTSTSAPAIGTTINLVTATDPATITYTNSPVVPAGYSFNTTTGVLTYNGSSLASSTNISSAGLPSNASLTVLAGNTLTIDQNATVNTITVAPGAQVTLNSGKTLTANNVELQSSASGTATFVDADATGKTVTGTIQQYLPTGRNWYVGIPVSNGDNSITANNLTAGGATSVSYWDEPTGAWVNEYTGTLTKGMGYIAVSGSGSATNNISFTGTFNTGDLSVALTRTVGATKEGFNLIANPYPSYLNAMTAITNANSVTSTVEPTIWYRTKGAVYSFETVNTSSGVGTNGVTGYIPPMQAFWVRALSNTSLTFTNTMRYHANPSGVTTTVLKAPSNIQNSLVRIQVSNGTTSDETVIYSNANASNSFDNYDSRKMSNNSALVPEIYTTVGAEQLVINGLNEIPVNAEIPLGFNNLKTGLNSFTLRAAELRNLSTDTKVYLLDKSTNTETELTNSSAYTFSSDATNTSSRFSVIFKSVGQTTGTTSLNGDKAIVYTNNGHIVFVANETLKMSDNNYLMIFDALGRTVLERTITSSVTEINNINTTGVYVIRAIVNGQSYSAKISLNR